MEVRADVVCPNMRNVFQSALDYEKCMACVKGWLSDPHTDRRVEYSKVMFFGLTIETVHLALSEAGFTIGRPPES